MSMFHMEVIAAGGLRAIQTGSQSPKHGSQMNMQMRPREPQTGTNDRESHYYGLHLCTKQESQLQKLLGSNLMAN